MQYFTHLYRDKKFNPPSFKPICTNKWVTDGVEFCGGKNRKIIFTKDSFSTVPVMVTCYACLELIIHKQEEILMRMKENMARRFVTSAANVLRQSCTDQSSSDGTSDINTGDLPVGRTL